MGMIVETQRIELSSPGIFKYVKRSPRHFFLPRQLLNHVSRDTRQDTYFVLETFLVFFYVRSRPPPLHFVLPPIYPGFRIRCDQRGQIYYLRFNDEKSFKNHLNEKVYIPKSMFVLRIQLHIVLNVI